MGRDEVPSLQETRLRALFSIRQLARKAGLSATTVHLLETGQRQPQLLTIYKISHALGVEPATIDEFRQVFDGPPQRHSTREENH